MRAEPIPAGAIGHIGMVAMLRRVEPEALAKMVLLRQPAGFVTCPVHACGGALAVPCITCFSLISHGDRPCTSSRAT